MEKKIYYPDNFDHSLSYKIDDYIDSNIILNEESEEFEENNEKDNRIFEIDENDFCQEYKNFETSIMINDKSFFIKEGEIIDNNNASFIYNNDDKNDYLNILEIIKEKKNNNVNSFFNQISENKSLKDISNNNNSKKTKESSNLTGNNYKNIQNFSQSFQS